jgi:hypothetical protein
MNIMNAMIMDPVIIRVFKTRMLSMSDKSEDFVAFSGEIQINHQGCMI